MQEKLNEYAFAVRPDEKAMYLLPVNSFGYVVHSFSPYYILVFILTLAFPMLLPLTVKGKIIWYVVELVLAGLFYVTLIYRSSRRQRFLEEIAREGRAVSATVGRQEIVATPEELGKSTTFHLIQVSFSRSKGASKEKVVLSVPRDFYWENSTGSHITLWLHKKNEQVAVLDEAIRAFFEYRQLRAEPLPLGELE